MDSNLIMLIYATFAIGVAGALYVLFKMRRVLAQDAGSDKMTEIAAAIQEGAAGFLRDEYRVLSLFVVAVTVLVGFLINIETAISFVLGALTSAGAGYLGMYVAVRANVRTAAAVASP